LGSSSHTLSLPMRSDCQAVRSFSPSARKLAKSLTSFAAARMSCATGPVAPMWSTRQAHVGRAALRSAPRKAQCFWRPRPSKSQGKQSQGRSSPLSRWCRREETCPTAKGPAATATEGSPAAAWSKQTASDGPQTRTAVSAGFNRPIGCVSALNIPPLCQLNLATSGRR
jgi:hypothetical protein